MQRAKKIFFAPGRRVAKGELFADDDPILNGREVLFESVDVPESPAPKEPEAEEPKEPGAVEESKSEGPKEPPAAAKPVRKAAAKKPAG